MNSFFNLLFSKKLYFFIFFYFSPYFYYSQSVIKFQNYSYNVFVVKVDSFLKYKLNIISNQVNLNFHDFLEEQITNKDSNIFVTNACINEYNGYPLGFLVSKGAEISNINYLDGTGNFFLKPNGIFSISDADVIICETSKFVKNLNVISATQSGPLLLNNGIINSQFNQISNNRFVRSGVGIYKDSVQNKFLVFVLSNDPVSFYEFSLFYKNYYNCSDALCLESVNSVMFKKEFPFNPNDNKKIIGNYIVYYPNSLFNKKTIKMTKSSSGIYEVPVELNGVLKISFIFDSGASDVSISPDVALTLIRTGTIEKTDFIGTQVYSFADGSSATSQVFILKEIKIGGHIIKNVKASISNSLNAPMLLGQTVLERLGKFSIDNNLHSLIIEE